MNEPADAPQTEEGGAEENGYRNRFLPIASWAMYDFANTLFSAMVVSLAMPRVMKEASGADSPMAWASACAMLLSAVAGPFLGATADATGTTKKQVLLWTVVCCACSALLSTIPTSQPWTLFGVFVAAYVAYNVAISLYDAFLPDICTEDRMGFISGLGVGIGYLGGLLGFLVAGALVKAEVPYETIFLAAGAMMFVFSIPMFLWVRERSGTGSEKFSWALGFKELRQAHRTITQLPKKPAIFLFLLGNLLAVDSLNAMIQWVGQFFREGWDADEETVIQLLLGLSVAATILGVVAGKVADWIGARRVMLASVAALGVVSLVDSFGNDPDLALWVTMLGGGLGAAGIWLTGRRVLVDLAPREQLGEYMGLLGITRKASIFGTLLLATLADSSGWKVAVGALSVPLAAGYIILVLSERAARKATAEAQAAA
ncbi:MAG: MFS transporter [Planctomycetota bacterium]